MNITKAMSGNVEQSYQSIIRNSNKDDYKKKLQIRKSPLNTKALLEHYYYSFNRSPPGHEYNQRNYYQNDLNIPQQKYMKKYDTDFINLDENINIDDYIKKNQNRKKITERSPIMDYNYNNNNKIQQNNNYYNYNKNYNNYNNNRNTILKHFQSDDLKDNRNNYQFNKDNNMNQNLNWKQKILQINDQKEKYNYYDTNNSKHTNTDQKRNTNYNYNDTLSDYSNQILSQSVNIDLTQPKRFYKFRNYNFNRNNNINFVNDYNKQFSHDNNVANMDLSENSFKNQTYQNYYYTNYNGFQNDESSSSNLYDDSYELNKTENYARRLKDKFSDVSKFLSVSSHENTSNDFYKDDETYNSIPFKRPKKNDEEHYHQNLTIKIKQKDEKNKKYEKNKKPNPSARVQKSAKYVDNKHDGGNISINTDYNKSLKEKKISNFKINTKDLKDKNMNSDLNYSNNSENYNNLSSTTMFIPSRKMKRYLDINNNEYFQKENKNKNRSPILNNNNKMKSKVLNNNNNNNDNMYLQSKDVLIQSRHLPRRSPETNMYKTKYNSLYNNNTAIIPLKNIFQMNNHKRKLNNYQNKTQEYQNNTQDYQNNTQDYQNKTQDYQNNTQDNIYNKIPKDKRIKEITVDLSPRKNFFNLANSNTNININNSNNNMINNITPNYDYSNLNNNNQNDYKDKYNFKNINVIPKPKSKIESCIITFDKPKNNNINNNKNNFNKKFKLSSSFDGLTFNKLKYIKKKIPSNNNTNINNNLNNNINNNINNNNYYETPGGMNINDIKYKSKKKIDKIKYNKNKSSVKVYQKPAKKKLSNSFGKMMSMESESNNEVKDYCAPSPYGKREKNLDENLYSDIYNHSPLLVSGNFNVIDNNTKKEQVSPYTQKYDEFSFKEKVTNINNNVVNYSNSKPIKVKIINSNDNNTNSINNNSKNNTSKNKNVYMKKTKTAGNMNSNNINASQRIPTFSNIEEIIKKDDTTNMFTKPSQQINDISSSSYINKITPIGPYELPKKEKLTKLTIKSFSKKKKEVKEKPQLLSHSFYKKYYRLYMMQPKKEVMYISKCFIKPIKKPVLSIKYISKNRYDYIYKLPPSSYEYCTKFKVPKTLILPKINVEYMTKTFIKSKEYIENKLNNIGNDKLINNNALVPLNTKKNININIQSKPVKKRIILIRKTKKANKKFYDDYSSNDNNNNINIENKNINNNIENNNNIDKNDNNENINNIISKSDDKKKLFEKKNSNNNIENKNNTKDLIEKKEEHNVYTNLEKIDNYLSKYNKNKKTNLNNDKIYFKKKNINVIKREKLLPGNKKFDNENSFTSDNDSLSFNLNINKEMGEDSKNSSKNNSRIFLFHKSIDNNSTIKSISNNSSTKDLLNVSSFYTNLVKAPGLNFSVIHNNLNHSIDNNDNSLSMISNNTINIELDRNKNNTFKKNDLKIKTVIRGVKKQSKYDYLKNYKKNKKIKISEIIKKPIKTKKEIEREKKVNLIIKEDLENYIVFSKNNNDEKKKYNWSMIEQLMIKIKLDIVDIINGYLIACDDLIFTKKYISITNDYIKNIILHYKYNYLTNKNFNNIHNKLLQLFLYVKDIKTYDSIKFEILGRLLNILINNNIIFANDLYIYRQADEQTKSNIRKIIINCNVAKKIFSKMPI